MTDLIRRADAIEAVDGLKERPQKYYTQYNNALSDAVFELTTLPSAEAVSMEEHVKELNDLASAWKNKFINAEKRTEEIYDETMAKVANECKECKERLRNLRPSAEAKPSVIRSKTLLPTKDFKEWAKRIKEVNPNAVVIPCDAEVASAEAEQTQAEKCEDCIHTGTNKDKITCRECASAEAVNHGRLIDADALSEKLCETTIFIKDGEVFQRMINDAPTVSAEAVQGWIPCSERLPSESDDYLCTIPLDADETYTEVLTFHKGRFYEDDDEWGATYHDDVVAWMPLPTPYKGGDDE